MKTDVCAALAVPRAVRCVAEMRRDVGAHIHGAGHLDSEIAIKSVQVGWRTLAGDLVGLEPFANTQGASRALWPTVSDRLGAMDLLAFPKASGYLTGFLPAQRAYRTSLADVLMVTI